MLSFAAIAVILSAICVDALPQLVERRQTLAPWAQCGGVGYSGSKTCPSGYSCQYSNDWYSQCLPGAGSSSSSSKVATTTTTAKTSSALPTSTGSTATTKATTTTSVVLPASPTSSGTLFRYLGRVNPATKELTWPGTGIAFSFIGSSASVPIKSITGTNAIQVVVDGGAPVVIDNVVGTSIGTPAGLSNGPHTVEIRKKSEALYGSIFIDDPITTGTLTPVPTPAKRIEIIGDSISVGYGLDGAYPCVNSAALENGPKTYGAIAAAALGADYSIVAWSGKGVIRNLDPGPLLPELWTRYGANDADNTYDFKAPVDYVVVNLGTNDFSYLGSRDPIDPAAYTAGLVSFAKQIQAKYPKAEIFLTSSPMLSDTYPTAADAQKTTQVNALKAAVAQIGAKAHFVDFPTQGADVGCDYHPNAATQASLGAILASAIKAVTG